MAHTVGDPLTSASKATCINGDLFDAGYTCVASGDISAMYVWQDGGLGIYTTADYDPIGSAAAVQANLDEHVAVLDHHTDVDTAGVVDGDLLIFAAGKWHDATSYEDCAGIVGDSTLPDTFVLSLTYIELVPTTAQTGTMDNMTYAAGRLKIDYSGAPNIPGPTDKIAIGIAFSLSVAFPTANTVFEASFAINGVAMAGADFIKIELGNGGQQTTDTAAAGSLFLPYDLVDGDEVSVVYRSNEAVNILSFVLEMNGRPVKAFT